MANVSKLVLSLSPGTTADQIRTILAGGHHSKSDLTAARTFFSNKLSTPVDFPRRKNEKAVDIIEHIAELVAFSNGTGPKPSFLDDDDQTPTSSPLRKTARGTGDDETPTTLPGRRLSFSLPDDNGGTNSSKTGELSLQSLSQILKALAATVANQAETITTSVRTALREDIQTEIKTELQTIVKRVETMVIERLEQVEEEALATRLKIDDNTTQIQQANIRIDDLTNQIEALEQDRRKSNLIVSGVPQRGKPPADVITSFLETDLKVTSVTPVDVLTLCNSRNPESPRFLIKLSSPADKFKVLRSCTALRGREISVSEDLTPKQQARRKELVPELRRRRKAGEIVFLLGDRLFKKETPTSAPRLVTTSPETQ